MTPKAPDYGHRYADKQLAALIRRLHLSYRQARISLQEKVSAYMAQFEKEDAKQRALYDSGELSREDYLAWRYRKIAGTQQWKDMLEQLTTDMVNQDKIAASMINDALPEVYAENHNYGTYEIEHDTQMSTSYTLYNRDAVARLTKDECSLLPVNPDIPKDKRWNRQHIQSSVLQGILTGEPMQKIADRFENVVGMDERAAMRNARTAVTGAENAGKLDSMRRAQGLGVRLKKLWLATRDSRTRDSHAMMDGELAEVEEPFSNGCMYPGDPEGAAAEIYNCRCAMRSKVAGADPYSPDLSRNQRLGGMSYEEWKQEARERIEEKEFKDAIRDMRARGFDNLSEDEISRAEKLASKEFAKNYKKISGDLDDEIRDAEEERNKFYQASYKNNQEDLSIRNEWERLSQNVTELQSSKAAAQAKALAETISKIRPVGIPKDARKLFTEHLEGGDTQLIKRIEEAYQLFPSDWVMHSLRFGKIRSFWGDGTYYENERKEISIAKNTTENRLLPDLIHELGHRFEQVVPGFLEAEKSYYNKRTKGCPREKLSDIYPDDFKEEDGYTRRDYFLEPYIGRDYGGSAFEIMSNGVEYAYTNPEHLAKDRDMQRWILNLLLFG